MFMVPRVDGVYLPEHPAILIREGRYNKVDIMSGLCAHEAGGAAGGKIINRFGSFGP